jgi:REM2 and Rab-like small GTPase 1
LLERPNITLSATEISYKICLAGKAGSGKSKVVSFLSGEHNPTSMYTETVGIHVKDVYWPVLMKGKITLFRLQFWEAGEMCSKKYSYIQSVS